MRKTFLLLTLCSVAATCLAPPAPAQSGRTSDPNFGHFYMGRQQITITDDSPVVNDQRTNPQAGGGNAGFGGMQGGPPPLPKAGWQPYSSQIPSVRTALPQVVNGVPPKMPPPGPSGMSGKAGALKAKKTGAAAPRPSSNQVQTYNAYKGYGGNLTPPSTYGSGSSAASYSTNTNVQGSVLHWARKKRSY